MPDVPSPPVTRYQIAAIAGVAGAVALIGVVLGWEWRVTAAFSVLAGCFVFIVCDNDPDDPFAT